VEGAAAWAQPPQGVTPQRRRTRQRCRDGSSLSVEWSVSPIQGRRGELLSHVCIGRDIDRQQKVEDGLRENDKLRAMATLAGGIAHDFNNLLGSIIGLTELCELEAVAGSRQARNLSRMHQASNKAAALVRQMLDFSRQSKPSLQRVTLADWLAHAEGLLRAALPRHQSLVLSVLDEGTVCIDLIQIEQVLLNMVRNAAQAIGERSGEVRIVTDRAEPQHSRPAAAGARHARLRVIDNGEGIEPELIGKIFEPFFTTKPVGEGTGLGLAAAHGIVTSHGGVIEVDSQVSIGTTFSIFLPLAEPAPATPAA
jgi:signal transduction histidine kinase